jgi:hypothetical protein
MLLFLAMKKPSSSSPYLPKRDCNYPPKIRNGDVDVCISEPRVCVWLRNEWGAIEKIINGYFKNKKFKDEKSEKAKQGNKQKHFKSLFIVEFEYGASVDGYWVYEHMMLQLKACVACVQVAYPEQDVFFLLDHSCGHDQQQEDGLMLRHD